MYSGRDAKLIGTAFGNGSLEVTFRRMAVRTRWHLLDGRTGVFVFWISKADKPSRSEVGECNGAID